jgi:hypothetical protein
VVFTAESRIVRCPWRWWAVPCEACGVHFGKGDPAVHVLTPKPGWVPWSAWYHAACFEVGQCAIN